MERISLEIITKYMKKKYNEDHMNRVEKHDDNMKNDDRSVVIWHRMRKKISLNDGTVKTCKDNNCKYKEDINENIWLENDGRDWDLIWKRIKRK